MEYDKRQEDIDLAVVDTNVKYLVKRVDDINEILKDHYVTQDQFEPIKKIVYGMVATILVAFIGAVIALVVK